MSEKRFKLAFEDFDGWAILDTTGEYSDDEDYIDWLSGQKAVDVLNHFAEENEELRQDNDIKFWKLQCIQSLNNNQVMLFELSRAIQQGYEVSDKFKQYMDKIKEHDKEIREKHKRLFE